ncbi:MAG: type VI secretion system-associated protein TagF [Geminicoccaceae bacterium]
MPGLPMSDSEARIGAFGKLPALGDFVARGLDPSFTEAWHGWLERGLAAARADLGESFLPAYMQAPAWRFALTAGLAGELPVTGIMVPSVDAVGRWFPLTLAAAGGRAEEPWYDALEVHARLALADEPLDAWLAGLAELPMPDATDTEIEPVTFWSEGSPFVQPGMLCFAELPSGTDFHRLLLEPALAPA